jgi:hypothetical protein
MVSSSGSPTFELEYSISWVIMGGNSGTSGIDGTSGSSGTSGADGTNGDDGSSGTSGDDGSSGTSGTDGSSGTSGTTPPTGLFSQTSNGNTITDTTTETSLIGTGVGGYTVPANNFAIGDSYFLRMAGKISCLGTANLIIRIKTTDGVLFAETGSIDLDTSTNRNWNIEVLFTIRNTGNSGLGVIVSSGEFTYIKDSGVTLEGADFSTINSTTFDTTVSNTLNITAEWNTASTSNIIYSTMFVLRKVY